MKAKQNYHPMTFVTGKGGVGKTRVSLLLSKSQPESQVAEANEGILDEAKFLQIRPPLTLRFTREDLAQSFLMSALKLKPLAKWLSQSSIFQTLMKLAPNLHEILLLQKWFEIAEDSPLIIDAPSTGNFLALFDAIETASRIFDGGMLKEAADKTRQYFKEGHGIKVIIVTLPENSALAEMKQIQERLHSIYPGIEIECLLNRKHCRPDLEPPSELETHLKQLLYERPQVEEARVQNFRFERILMEGAVSL